MLSRPRLLSTMKAILHFLAAGCLACSLLIAGCDFAANTPDGPRASLRLLPARTNNSWTARARARVLRATSCHVHAPF